MPADIWTALEMADMTAKGLPPAAGGALDQTQVFLDACRFVWAEQAATKAEIEAEAWRRHG